MANRTGLLVLHSHTVVSSILLSKVLTSALEKIERTLYVQVADLQSRGNSVGSLNRLVNQIYFVSSKNASHIDTRVILRDFRDTLLEKKIDNSSFTTSRSIDITMSDSKSKVSSSTKCTLVLEAMDGVLTNDGVPLENQSVVDLSQGKIYDNVVLGGTFDRLHAGHKILLSAAILRCSKKLTIGVTDGPMIKTKKLFELIEPCETRIAKLREFLNDIEPRLQYKIVPITDPYGPTAEDPDLQMIVVSDETLKGGQKVNDLRKEKGLSILDILSIELIEDVEANKDEESKVSSSSLRKRLLGTLLKPSKVKTKPYIIGLTGGIASGKTSICLHLKNLGAHIVSCDHLGHQAYKKGTNCYNDMLKYFGDAIIDANGEIDRKKLGPIVFSDKVHLEKLNSMVWPEIRRLYLNEIEQLKNQGYTGVIVLDAAILLEAQWDQDCNEVWVSIVPPSEAVKRIMDRDKLSSDQATKRIESQLSNSERVEKCNVVFCSVWEPDVTRKQVETAWKRLREYLSAD